jgi:glycosyltransferase involved in cell wall biosynthesis
MKIRMHENDPRYYNEPFEQFVNNCGSFSTIIHQLNKAFERMGVLARSEAEADFVGFSSGLDLNFYPEAKRRFLIHVWESNILPQYFIDSRKALGENYTFFGLSEQISNLWRSNGFPTETIDLGVDAEFWKPDPQTPKNEKFTFLSVTACNFRSGVNHLISAYSILCAHNEEFKNGTKLIIKNTEERAIGIPEFLREMKDFGWDVEYILERQTNQQLRELYNRSHALVYIPTNTSGGIPILEAAAMELLCLVPDYSPTNLYPFTAVVPTVEMPISVVKDFLTKNILLPYTFPPSLVDENKATLNMLNDDLVAGALMVMFLDHQTGNNFYARQAKANRQKVIQDWTWDKSAEKIVKYLTEKYN